MKRIAFTAVLCVFTALNAYAAMISFFVIETGLPEDIGIRRSSHLLENAFMDVFFEAGHIVGNYPMLRLYSPPEGDILEEANVDMIEAIEAGVDYIVTAVIDYNPANLGPSKINFSIFRLSPYQKMHEKQIAGKTYRNEREEFDDLKKTAGELVPYFNN